MISANQVVDFEADGRERSEGNGITTMEFERGAISSRAWIAVDQDRVMLKIFDPKLGDASLGIQPQLVAVAPECRIGHLDHQKSIFPRDLFPGVVVVARSRAMSGCGSV